MSADKPGLEEEKNMMPDSPAEDQQTEEEENVEAAQASEDANIADTQERADALGAVPESDDAPSDPPMENINTDPELDHEDAGEISGPPVDSIDTTEDVAEASSADEPVSESEAAPESDTSPAEEAADAPTHKFSRGDLVTGKIATTTPTSVTVDLGDDVEGVIPGRELERMSRGMLDELKEGEDVLVYVVNPHDHQGNVLLSINRAIEENDWKEAEAFRKDQRAYDGNIAGYNKGGLIVRFGSLRGFVPQSQISDERRRDMQGETPEERYSAMVNEAIVVKVMEVDRSRNRLILSERAAAREQREQRKEALIKELEVGQVCEGRVVSLEDFGAFVDIGGAEGLVHLTEIAWKHVTHPREALKVGQETRVEVISIDRDRKRIGLSIKRQEADPWDEVATTYQVGDLVQATVTKLTKFGAFARLVEADDIEGLIHISELSEERVSHPRDVVNEAEKLTLRVVKIDVKNRRLGLSLKRVNSAEYLDRDLKTFASESDE